MGVTHYFIVGSATIPSSWVALMIGFLVAYIMIRLKYGKQLSELLVDAIFYFILVWKLSVILTQFGNVISSPLSILYFNGGRVGVILGILVAGIKVLVALKKNKIKLNDIQALFLGVVIIQTVYQIVMVLLNEATVLIQVMTISSFVLFSIFTWLMIVRGKYSPIQLPVLFTAVHLFVASFQPAGLFGSMATMLMSLFFIVISFKERVIESEGTV